MCLEQFGGLEENLGVCYKKWNERLEVVEDFACFSTSLKLILSKHTSEES